MKIKAFIETSFVDWDGKISCTIFLGECNLKCIYCHNHPFLEEPESFPDIPWERIKEHLLKCREWLEGVVLSGGEPLLHHFLPHLLLSIKEMGLATKIDTNGTFPKRLKEIVSAGLVDYVAMDIKAPFNKMYEEITETKVNFRELKESVSILLSGKIDYEFRTTLIPSYHNQDSIRQILEEIKGAKRYVLQEFEPKNARKTSLRTLSPLPKEDVAKMLEEAKKFIKNVKYRGRWSLSEGL